MTTSMNSLVIQATAVGVVTVIALFPTKDHLRTALDQHTRAPIGIPTSYGDREISAIQAQAITTHEANELPRGCLSDLGGSPQASIACATELSHYIQLSEVVDSATRSVARAIGVETPDYPIHEVEQARRALISLCRTRWASQKVEPDAAFDAACDPPS